MEAPERILRLMDQFRASADFYRSSGFKETPTREQFINPMFEALGWNVRSRGLAETEKEVVLEQSVTIGASTKSIDYAFRIDGVTKFIVEAKAPHKNLAADKLPAIQVRRYGWNLGIPLAVVTDFEEFAVYDCRIQPDNADGPKVARVEYIHLDDLSDRWESIENLFSRRAVLEGSIEEWAANAKKRRGVIPVDEAFLVSINRWRAELADDLVKRNPTLTESELNFAVQSTIDRIVFLRICEDRGLEREGDLLDATHQPGVYQRLLEVFVRADQRYNSGLFHFRKERNRPGPDALTPSLAVGDSALRSVITSLYGPQNVFEFRVIPTDILGRVYEQFLGQVVIRQGNTAGVVDKPEVRKAGGVYYTPEWVVDYIVKETLAPLLKNTTPADVARIRIVDPACGSGSFLLGAFQQLLDWHLRYYTKTSTRKRRKELARDAFGNWRLTLEERRRILLNNIYGVDIDPQAVEVAKLSLLLKVIEGENQLAFAIGRLLPDLDANIKQGNSIVGPDLFDYVDVASLTTEQMRSLVPFDWERGFPDVALAGGFDVVIGNPPYLNVDAVWGKRDPRLVYLKASYSDIYNDKTDLLFYFLYQAVSLAKREASMIVSRAFLEAFKANRLRRWLGSHTKVREIVDFQNAYVFPGVGITTAIVRFTHSARPGKAVVRQLQPRELPPGVASRIVRDPGLFREVLVEQGRFGADSWSFANPEEQLIHRKIDAAGDRIGDVLHIGKGMETGANRVFGGLTRADVTAWRLPDRSWFHRARNSDIQRWHITRRDEVLLYPEAFRAFGDLPAPAREYLEGHEDVLTQRAAYERGDCEWWRYTWPLHASYSARPRILCPYLATGNRFALDKDCDFLGLTDTTILYDDGQPEDLRWFVGFLNSSALAFRFQTIGKLKSAGIREYFENTVSQLVVPRTHPRDPDHQRMVDLVNKASVAADALAKANTPVDTEMRKAQLHGIEQTIDHLVYSRYGLGDDEIKTIEAGVS